MQKQSQPRCLGAMRPGQVPKLLPWIWYVNGSSDENARLVGLLWGRY